MECYEPRLFALRCQPRADKEHRAYAEPKDLIYSARRMYFPVAGHRAQKQRKRRIRSAGAAKACAKRRYLRCHATLHRYPALMAQAYHARTNEPISTASRRQHVEPLLLRFVYPFSPQNRRLHATTHGAEGPEGTLPLIEGQQDESRRMSTFAPELLEERERIERQRRTKVSLFFQAAP